MTIPRQLGPETTRRALPDYSRSDATVERMVRDLRGPGSPAGGSTRMIRALFPAAATRDTVIRAVCSALLLGTALLSTAVGAVLLLSLEDGRSPGLGMLLVLLALAAVVLMSLLLGIRFGIVALATARARVEVTEDGLVVVGIRSRRLVRWEQILAVESRVVHPLHWLTAALRLKDGSRVVMPAFDRHIWNYSQPSGRDIRMLRTELHRRESRGGLGR